MSDPVERAANIAYVSADRQVHVLDVHGNTRQQTGGGNPAIMWGSWDESSRTAHSWPTWSPDGTQLACFASVEDEGSSVLVMDVDGISSIAVSELGARLPIYLFWSPSGTTVAILTQQLSPDRDRLHLALAKADTPGSEHTLAEGTPLFFTWAGERIAAFIGDPETHDARLAVLPATTTGATTLLPGRPGNFCAPVWIDDRLLYVLQHRHQASVVMSGLHDAEPTVIEGLRGLVALVRSRDGRMVARAVAPGGDGTPYHDLAVIDVATGIVTQVSDEPCLAFMWLPDGSGLVTARVDTERNLMAWHRVGLDGTSLHLVDMYPTRDFGFYLRFFEQYTQSHHLVDPHSKTLLLAGGVHGEGDAHNTSALWEVALDGSGIKRVADGLFGVYGPEVQP